MGITVFVKPNNKYNKKITHYIYSLLSRELVQFFFFNFVESYQLFLYTHLTPSYFTNINNNLWMFQGGVGMGYKPMVNDGIGAARPDHLFSDEIEDLVKRPQPNDVQKVKVMLQLKSCT